MKISFTSIQIAGVLVLSSFFFPTGQMNAQVFQKMYGTNLGNTFSKVIEYGNDYYVLGSQEISTGGLRRATVTKLDATGAWQWTTRLDIPSQWNDGVFTPAGDLMLVGHTLPYNSTNESLIGKIDVFGAFNWVNSYDEPLQQSYTRIRYNATPDDPLYPYYILGSETQYLGPNGIDDAVVLTLDEFGNFYWKSRIAGPGDDEIDRDLEIMPGGDLIIAGSEPNVWGVVLRMDNTGIVYTGFTPSGELIDYVDLFVQPVTGIIYTTANSTINQTTYLFKFDTDMNFPYWEYELAGLNEIDQIWTTSPTDIYVTGSGFFNGLNRKVLMYFIETGVGTITFQWLKFLDNNEIAYEGGFATPLTLNRVAFVDGRTPPAGGFGGMDAFMSASNASIGTCITQSNTVVENPISFLYNGPVFPNPLYDTLPIPNVVPWSSMTYAQQSLCSSSPCVAAFSYSLSGNCGAVQFTDLSTSGNPIINYCWDFDGNLSTCENNTQNPFVQFPNPQCQNFKVCLIITTQDSCIDTVCQTLVIADVIPPAITCPFDITIACDDDDSPANTGYATATDNCPAQPTIVNYDVTLGTWPCNSIIQRTWYAIDQCLNSSSCVQTITVIDNIPPQLSNCPNNITVTVNAPSPCSQFITIPVPVATDACDFNVSVTNNYNGGLDASGVYPDGVTTVVYTATDDCGNIATCSFTVTVICINSLFQCGQAVVSCFSGFVPFSSAVNPNGPVLAIADIRHHSTAPLGVNWTSLTSNSNLQGGLYHHNDWTAQKMGQVFGVTTDNQNNIYASSSTIYGIYLPSNLNAAAFGNVYKVNGNTGQVTTIATLPQDLSHPAGLGDIWYDNIDNQLFVSNFFDGMIYRLGINGNILGPPYKFQGVPGHPFGPAASGFIPRGERVWALARHKNKLYFSVWNDGRSTPNGNIKNQIWSVDIIGGALSGNATLEIDIPDIPGLLYSSPVSDISFSQSGNMLLGERTMYADIGDASGVVIPIGNQAHYARILEYTGAGWGIMKIIFVGNTGSHLNSAGGIDYGYESFNPSNSSSPTQCDSMIWGTGDALRLPPWNSIIDPSGIACGGGINDLVYGLTGIRSTGNSDQSNSPQYVNNKSIYIDVDNNICNMEKVQIGDMDVFKYCLNCTTPDNDYPCDSLMVVDHQINPIDTNACCYEIDFENYSGSITEICADLTPTSWIFNSVSVIPGYSFQLIGSNKVCVTHVTGSIPVGSNSGVLTFCLAQTQANAPSQQQIIFDWKSGMELVCRDTSLFSCSPSVDADTCLIISGLMAICDDSNDYEYCVSFTVQNISGAPATALALQNLPAGFSFDDCGCNGNPNGTNGWLFDWNSNPLNHGSSRTMCVKIISSLPVLRPGNICFNATIESNSVLCSSSKNWCVDINPCCDPCENMITSVSELDSCCYQVDLNYGCDYRVFTKIDFDIITPGVEFGLYTVMNPWIICGSFPLSHVCIQPPTGIIPPGQINNLFSFCLKNVTQPSQSLKITYWMQDINGQDSVACDTVIVLYCDASPCARVTHDNIQCIEDSMKYKITVTVKNVSSPPFIAYSLDLAGPGLSPNPVALVPPLPNDGTTRTVTYCYTPSPWPDPDGLLMVSYGLNGLGSDSICFNDTAFVDTLILPICDTCECLGFINTEIYYTHSSNGWQQSFFCDTNFVDSLPCIQSGDVINFRGDFLCTDSCTASIGYDIFSYALNTVIFTGTVSTTPLGGNAFHFDLLTGFNLIPGQYQLTLRGGCGSNTCLCDYDFKIEECNPLCANNLVPNPGFELYNACPPSLALINYATHWSQPTNGTPDFLHACTNPLSIIHVPNNLFGYQVPHGGSGYAGFVLYRPAPATYMEYIETGLSSPLVAGMTYDISFYVNLADESSWAIDQMGAYLSVGAVGFVPIIGPLALVPQIINASGNYITDKNNWTLVSGTYTAIGGEDHIVIGNFGGNTTAVSAGSASLNDAYYFIDDISVCPKITVDITDSNQRDKVKLYPNPSSDHVTIDLGELHGIASSIRIMDITGNIFSEYRINTKTSLQELLVDELLPGVYLIQIVEQDKVLCVKKLVKM